MSTAHINGQRTGGGTTAAITLVDLTAGAVYVTAAGPLSPEHPTTVTEATDLLRAAI